MKTFEKDHGRVIKRYARIVYYLSLIMSVLLVTGGLVLFFVMVSRSFLFAFLYLILALVASLINFYMGNVLAALIFSRGETVDLLRDIRDRDIM